MKKNLGKLNQTLTSRTKRPQRTRKASPPNGNKTRKTPHNGGQIDESDVKNPIGPRQSRSTSRPPEQPKPPVQPKPRVIIGYRERFKYPDTGAVTTDRGQISPGRNSSRHYKNKQ
jgi:hypothetical protein